MIKSVVGAEFSLDAFLSLDPYFLPPKGTLLRVTRRKSLPVAVQVQNIVFEEVQDILCKSIPIPMFPGKRYLKRQLIGLDLEDDVLNLKKKGKVQVLLTRVPPYKSNPLDMSLNKIEIIAKDRFEYICKFSAALGIALENVLATPCIGIVREYIFLLGD